ncbi:hypothetical protein QTP88_000169 [Uroleucon formosanum]
MVVYHYTSKRKMRRKWVKNWLARSDLFGHMPLLKQLNENEPNDLKNYLRMSKTDFDRLLDLLRPRITKQDTVMRQAIPAEERLIATGKSYEDLKFSTGIAAQTLGSIIPETCKAIYEILQDTYMKVPQKSKDWKEVANGFKDRWQMINCGGCIDGKHIRICQPARSGALYYNYNNFYSIVLMAIVNHNYELIYVDVGKQGRISDGGVIQATTFYRRLQNETLNLPKPMDLENAFGLIASRFRILQTSINVNPNDTNYIVLAICTLHNFLIKHNSSYVKPTSENSETQDTEDIDKICNDSTFFSPSAYSYVRTIFSKALPDVSTIRKWYSKLDGLPGMTKESFQAISLKVKEMKVNGKQLYGCLVMDEMSIKQHVHWTGTRHQGYIDFGLGGKTEEMDNLPYAKDAFVIMVVGMNTSWKVPIAYYLINGISAEEKANIILNCLQELDTTGIIIKILTFDGAANNLSMASELGANLQYSELKPYFLHPNTNDKIHIILEPCHVVKLLINCLGDWKILYTTNGETIKWSYFKNLVNHQNESGLHSATKLRNRHIYYFREKMKVKLAVQTFSISVANAILFCMNDLKLDNFQGADATIEFCLRINNNFDILNTRNFLSKGTYNKSINKRTKTEIVHYIEESIDYLAGGFNAMKNQQNVVSCQY